MTYFKQAVLKTKQIFPGITMRSIYGEKTMITIFDFEPGAEVPVHRHPHEQITYILEGEMEFTLNGETQICRAGDGIVILANQDHGAKVLGGEPTRAIDAWYPQREDYKIPDK